jgi:uncharacterized protein (TIGR02996 family)
MLNNELANNVFSKPQDHAVLLVYTDFLEENGYDKLASDLRLFGLFDTKYKMQCGGGGGNNGGGGGNNGGGSYNSSGGGNNGGGSYNSSGGDGGDGSYNSSGDGGGGGFIQVS